MTFKSGLGAAVTNTVPGFGLPWYCALWPWQDACMPVADLPTPANVRAPIAPLTQNQLTNPTAWTPEEAAAWSNYVAAQAQQAVTEDRTFWSTASTGQTPTNSVGQPPTPETSNNTLLWVVGGIAATLFLLTAVKR